MGEKKGRTLEDFLQQGGLFNGKENEYLMGVIRENGEEDEIPLTGSNVQELRDSFQEYLSDDARENPGSPQILTDRIAYLKRAEMENRFSVNMGYGEEAVKVQLGENYQKCAETKAGIPLQLVYADGPDAGKVCTDLTSPVANSSMNPYVTCIKEDAFPGVDKFLENSRLAQKTTVTHQQGGMEHAMYRFDKSVLQQFNLTGMSKYETAAKEALNKAYGAHDAGKEQSVGMTGPEASSDDYQM